MKLMDPKNVMVRADRMMLAHLDMFSKYYGEYEKSGTHYYFCDNGDERVKVDLQTGSKLLSKIYNITVKQVIGSIEMDHDWKVKSSFLGALKLEGIIFKGKDKESKDVADRLNQDDQLMNHIFELAKDIDLQNISIEYISATKEIEVSIYPYAGTLIWIKLPPIYQDIRLHDDEAEIIYKLTNVFRDYFHRNYKRKH